MKYVYVALVLGVFVLSGCHSNLYSGPRTMPKGRFSHTVALDIPTYKPIPAPMYMVRVGIADRIDMGLHITQGLKLDLKANIVRTKRFDFSVNPMVGVDASPFRSTLGTMTIVSALPGIIGVNFSPEVTFVMQAGPGLGAYRAGSYEAPSTNVIIYPLLGAGFQFRISNSVLIQPEVGFTFLKAGAMPWPVVGVGLGFGAQPKYE